MGELKYKYAFDEIGNIVSIEDFTKESSKLHTFKCIVCGDELRPRAIGSKHRRAHFYHKEIVSCNGESYLHKLGKLYIKNKFDNSGVTFKAVDFVLEPPKAEDEPMMSDEQIQIRNFYYSDIYEDGLVERVKKANQETIEYYEEQDKIKDTEISGQ